MRRNVNDGMQRLKIRLSIHINLRIRHIVYCFPSPTNQRLRLLVQGILNLLHQTLLLVSTLGAMGTSTVLVGLGLSDGVVLSGTLSTSQGAVATGTIGVGLVTSIVIGVSALASSTGVGSELVVLGAELSVNTCRCKLKR